MYFSLDSPFINLVQRNSINGSKWRSLSARAPLSPLLRLCWVCYANFLCTFYTINCSGHTLAINQCITIVTTPEPRQQEDTELIVGTQVLYPGKRLTKGGWGNHIRSFYCSIAGSHGCRYISLSKPHADALLKEAGLHLEESEEHCRKSEFVSDGHGHSHSTISW